MYYVYILRSIKDGNLYIGFSNNLKRRIVEHNQGKSFATSYRRPFKLIYYEAYLSKDDAKKREKFLKTGWGRNYIKKNLHNTLKI